MDLIFKKLSFKGIPNRIIYTAYQRYELAHEQEIFVLNILKKEYPEYILMLTSEWAESDNNEANRIFGDIVIIDPKTYKCIACFDLKVQQYGNKNPKYVGTIMMNSYFGFGYNFNNHYYLMCNEFGENVVIINANVIEEELIKKNVKFISKTKYTRKVYNNSTYNKFIKNYIDDVCDVGENDYIQTRFIMPYNLIK